MIKGAFLSEDELKELAEMKNALIAIEDNASDIQDSDECENLEDASNKAKEIESLARNVLTTLAAIENGTYDKSKHHLNIYLGK